MANQLHTVWGKQLNPDQVLPEHPRPRMMRSTWENLNGWWDYAVTPASGPGRARGEGPDAVKASSPASSSPDRRQPLPAFSPEQKILVPFSPESVLSGVGRQLQPDEVLWYRRYFRIGSDSVNDAAGTSPRRRVLLHFGAVDQFAAVYINRRKAGSHIGGYLPFSLDITDYLREGENEVIAAVRDVSDTSYHSRGHDGTHSDGGRARREGRNSNARCWRPWRRSARTPPSSVGFSSTRAGDSLTRSG